MKIAHISFLLIFLSLDLPSYAQKGLLVAVQQRADSVLLYDLGARRTVAQLPTGYKPHEIAYDSRTKKCFITNFGVEDYDRRIGRPGNSITVIDPITHRVVKEILTGPAQSPNCPHGIKVRPGKLRELFVNLEVGDSMQVYDLGSFKLKRSFHLPQGTHNFVFSADGDSLWLMAGPNGVFRIDPDNGDTLCHRTFSSPIRGLTVTARGLLASGKNELFLLSGKDLSVRQQIADVKVGQILYSAATPDGKYILSPAAFDSTVLVIDAATGNVIHRLRTSRTPINVQIIKDYAFVSHAEDDYITQIDLRTFEQVRIRANGTNGMIIIQ
jgi:DNA-binding beta-propeller fold protein YncE